MGTDNGIVFGHWPRSIGSRGFEVTDEELVLFLPGPECPAIFRPLPPPPGSSLLPLGRTRSGAVVGIPLEGRQGRHLAILGETGMGKSSLLVALAHRMGRDHGIVLLDPVGETAEAFDRHIDPRALGTRYLRIDPVLSPVRVNALEGIGPPEVDSTRSERRLNDLVHAFRRVRAGRYAGGFWGPRIDEMVTRALRAAAVIEKGTIADAHALLATGGRTYRDLPPASLGPMRELAERIRERPDDAEGARRLLYELVRSATLERMLSARDPDLSIDDLVAPGRVVVISGHAARVGESTARYLLSVYLALVWSSLLAQRVPAKTFVLLDEAQWFAHESLAEMLTLGRKRNVHVVLATQSVGSLEPESLPPAVWTNVADFVAFRGSPAEAKEFAALTVGITPEQLLALPRGEAAALRGKGTSVRWIRTARLPSREPVGEPSRPATDSRPSPGPGRAFERSSEAPASPPHGAPSPGDATPPTGEESLVEHLRARAGGTDPGALLRVPLDELRARAGSDEGVVRRVGGRLGRTGALVRREEGPDGGVWVIDPTRLPPPGDMPEGGTDRGGSSPRQS